MLHRSCFIAAFVLVTCATMLAVGAGRNKAERVIYVSPEGNDRWSGKHVMPLPDGSDGPVASPQKATELASRLRRDGYKGTIRVVFQPGTYSLAEPWRVDSAVSGYPDGPTVFEASETGEAVISGGVTLTPWTAREDGLWEASLPRSLDGKQITQLFVGGTRRTRARHPNEGYLRTLGPEVPWRDRQAARRDQSTKMGIRVRLEDLPEDEDLTYANVLVFHSWTASRHFIKSIDREQGIIRFTAPSNWPMGYWERSQRWYIENVRSALDAPGEWYWDAAGNMVLYKPFPGEQPQAAQAIVPGIPELLVLEGSSGRPVEHVYVRGLAFRYAAWSWPRDQRCDGQAAAFLDNAALHVRNARFCRWVDCSVEHVGTYGLWLDNGSKNNEVIRCRLVDLGAGGIRIGATTLPEPEELRAERNVVTNCVIHQTGQVFHAGVGIWVGKSSYNRLEHNHICDLFYTGISVGWSWGYAPSSAHHNLIRFNEIHKVGQGVLSDMGGIYTLGISPGTVLGGNWIYDVESYSYGGWGIYPDEGSSYLEIRNNITERTKTGGFHQHYGRENRVYNNIFAFSRLHQLQRTRREDHISFFFERNVVVYDTGSLMAGAWGDNRVVLDHNLYWNYSGPVVFPGNRTLQQWQALGHDRHSLVADPRFIDAKAGDFRLLDDSPLPRIGFTPFTLVGRAGPVDPDLHGCPAEAN